MTDHSSPKSCLEDGTLPASTTSGLIAASSPGLHFGSRRSEVYSTKGMVSCSQPLAAQIGCDILRSGGNAVDAAIAVAAALNVTEPCSTGLGGDCFMLYYDASTQKVHSLNGSGRAAKALDLKRVIVDVCESPEKFASTPRDIDGNLTLQNVNKFHVHTITVPGTAAGWCDAVAKWGSGKKSLKEVLEPAINLAREGFPVSPITAHWWKDGEAQLRRGPHAAELLNSRGNAPQAGEIFRNPNLANVMTKIAEGGKDAFYAAESPIAQAIGR